MLNQISLYAILGLIVVVLALSGGWYFTSRMKSAEIETLSQRNAALTSAVETNERTIAEMIADAQTLAASNQKLTSRIVAAEIENATAWQTIDELDLRSDTAIGDTTGLETRVNDTFAKTIDALRTTTAQ